MIYILSFIFYYYNTFYQDYSFYKYFEKKDRNIVRCKTASLINALICSIFSILYIDNFISDNLIFNIHQIILSYFIVDLIYILQNKNKYNKINYILFIIHHIASIIGSKYLIYIYPNIISQLYIAELSTIFLNISWFILHINPKIKHLKQFKQCNLIFKLSNILLFISFFCTRNINYIYIQYSCIQKLYTGSITINLIIINILIFASILLNYYWFYCLVRLVIKPNNSIKKS